MPLKNTDKKASNKNKSTTSKKLRKNNRDDDDDEVISLEEGEIYESSDDDDYETLSDDDSEEDDEDEDSEDDESEYLPPRRKSKRNRKYVDLDDDDDEEDEDDEDIDYENDSDLDPKELRKTLAALFPSNYINQKIKKDEKEEKKNKKVKKNIVSKKKKTKKQKKYDSSSDEEDEEEIDYDSEDDSDYDDDEDDLESASDFNIILTMGGGGQAILGTEDDEDVLVEDNDECDSDDEKTFMKENYQTIEMPENIQKNDEAKKEKKNKKKKKRHNKTETSEENEEELNIVDNEYKELVELKKHLSEKVKANPKSKHLTKQLEDCRQSIRKLVKKSRMKNAKKYHKLINTGAKRPSELEYFKKEMSNQEQLRVMKELKKVNEHIDVKKPYRLSLLDSSIPPKYKATVLQKVNMLRSMEPGDPEYYKLKTWVDAFMRIPFGVHKNLSVSRKDGIDVCSEFMENAKKTLDDCVYGLNDAKMQIMQMIGQWITNPNALGSAIAIKGPPGTGKTSLVKEGISKILGREFTFIALGGTGDSSFLEGHSYTYEGSLWGKIVQILMDSKCMNPVIYFDELDKVSDSARGQEIIGILTHLTDTSQNSQFHDKYFADIDFDLSKCLFIFSYNDESKINPILRDRMYRIETNGYDAKEKLIIARDFLLPKIREQVSFSEDELKIPDETIKEIIGNKVLTKSEEGVRNLKRCLEVIHTKLNLFRLMKPEKNLFEKEMDLKIQFPIEVNYEQVRKLIKSEEEQNQSILALYI
jgi:ATP-dependent Lon protease